MTKKKDVVLVRSQRGSPTIRVRRDLDDIQWRSRHEVESIRARAHDGRDDGAVDARVLTIPRARTTDLLGNHSPQGHPSWACELVSSPFDEETIFLAEEAIFRERRRRPETINSKRLRQRSNNGV
jgi:hypothetical protein